MVVGTTCGSSAGSRSTGRPARGGRAGGWNKRRAGIVHGPERTATTHPDMLGSDQLDEVVKEKDRMFIRGLLELLKAEDLAIVRQARQGSAT